MTASLIGALAGLFLAAVDFVLLPALGWFAGPLFSGE